MTSSPLAFVGLPGSIFKKRRPKGPLCRVELHVHLDGSLRPDTIQDLSKNSNHRCAETLHELIDKLRIDDPKDLNHFLSRFSYFMPLIRGNLEAIHRIAKEFCEDSANNGSLYVEARYSPHLMASPEKGVTPANVIEAISKGFEEGEKHFGVKVRSILCCIQGLPVATFKEVLDLCVQFKGKGVVAIDVAGDEASCASFTDEEIAVFNDAKKLGIHRTVHAGESGPAENVEFALQKLHAERIGHGYRVIGNDRIYQDCLKANVHFEVCPSSSVLTGAVPLNVTTTMTHPLLRFVQDGANFSINTDDPTITGTYLQDEWDLVRSWGLSDAHLIRATFNAARASFLPENEKLQLISALRKAYGVDVPF